MDGWVSYIRAAKTGSSAADIVDITISCIELSMNRMMRLSTNVNQITRNQYTT